MSKNTSKSKRYNLSATAPLTTEIGTVRIGPIAVLPQVLTDLGVSPQVAFRQAGIPVSLFDNPEHRIPYQALGHLLLVCFELTGRNDFGILLGSRFKLQHFGDLGGLMRNSATVRDALRTLIVNLRYYDRVAFCYLLKTHPRKMILGYTLEHPAMPSTPIFYDASIAIAYRILRELCGPAWTPNVVRFSHRAPEDLTPYRRLFGPKVRFDTESSGVEFDASFLNQPIAGANSAEWLRLDQRLRSAGARGPLNFTEEVQTVLHQLLLGGSTSTQNVANLFAISERTLRMRLADEGTNFSRLLAEIRYELACHLLLNTALPISKIASSLCCADSAVFSRAFHGWAGISPRQWRKEHISKAGVIGE